MKIKQCCKCQSKEIIRTQKEVYCGRCGLVLASTTQYIAGQKYYLPFGLIFG